MINATPNTPKKYRRADYPDSTTTERAHRLLALNNAAARRLGYNTMADLVGDLRGALLQGGTNADVDTRLLKIVTNLSIMAMTASAFTRMKSETTDPEKWYSDAPAADLAAIMAKWPPRTADHSGERKKKAV